MRCYVNIIFYAVILCLLSYKATADSSVSYSYNVDSSGNKTIRSVNAGKKQQVLRWCQQQSFANYVVSADCDIAENTAAAYTKLFVATFEKLKKITATSLLSEYYQLSERNFCFYFVKQGKSFDYDVSVNPCLTFYFDLPDKFNQKSKNHILGMLQKITHENSHALTIPSIYQNKFSSLLVNEYATSLLQLDTVRIVRKISGLADFARPTFQITDRLLSSKNLSSYCKDISALKRKIEVTGSLDSILGGTFAIAFLKKLPLDPTFHSFYIANEIEQLASAKVTDQQLLHRLGLCENSLLSYHQPLSNLLLPAKITSEELGFDIEQLYARNYNAADIKKFCVQSINQSSCQQLFAANANLTSDQSINTAETISFIPVAITAELGKDYRYREHGTGYLYDTAASSNVFSAHNFDCATTGSKWVKRLNGSETLLKMCAENTENGTIWLSQSQQDNVLSLRTMLKKYPSIEFLRTKIQPKQATAQKFVNYMYVDGMINFSLQNADIRYCLDTGSQFSYLTKRYQQRFFHEQWLTPHRITKEMTVENVKHHFIDVDIGGLKHRVKPNVIAGNFSCDIILGADFAEIFTSVIVSRHQLQLTSLSSSALSAQ